MIAITKLIMLGIAVVCAVTLAFIILDFVADKAKNKSSKKINRVHFYVARDKYTGTLYLYLGKPYRDISKFFPSAKGCIVEIQDSFYKKGLNPDDFKNLKWEDEPVEVFLNMED